MQSKHRKLLWKANRASIPAHVFGADFIHTWKGKHATRASCVVFLNFDPNFWVNQSSPKHSSWSSSCFNNSNQDEQNVEGIIQQC